MKDLFIVGEPSTTTNSRIGRGWMQAPEVDGVTLIRGRAKPAHSSKPQ
jgi:hypothetical protein